MEPEINPITTPPQNPQTNPLSPEKSGKSKRIILVFIGLLLLALVGAGGYFLGSNGNDQTYVPPSDSAVPTVTTNNLSDITPTKNALYLANYKGKQVIFQTDYSEGSFQGKIIFSGGSDAASYKDLENPVKILNDAREALGFAVSGDNIYLAFFEPNQSDKYPNSDEVIYKFTIGNEDKTGVWRHQVNLNDGKYKNSAGWGYIDQVEGNQFLVLSILSCYACEGDESGKAIVNLNTKNEVYLEKIGNVKINTENKTFSYQKLAPFKEACEASPGCDDNGQRTVYKPSGQTFTEPLP